MKKINQSTRLTQQQINSNGVLGIFGNEAKKHDIAVGEISKLLFEVLINEYPTLKFRYRKHIEKKEINKKLNSIDSELGQTLFVEHACIKPDGGIIEVQDDNGNWRVVLVTEAKYQGKDIENIKQGKLVGKDKNQDLMVAGNAIERSYKNIVEIANFMLDEGYFPYLIFLEGTNFLTEDISVTRPDGRIVVLKYNSGSLNRLDRLSAANYGMKFNTNLCINKYIKSNNRLIMLQAPSIYTTGNGNKWKSIDMFNIMMDISKTSLKFLGSSLFNQLTHSQEKNEGEKNEEEKK